MDTADRDCRLYNVFGILQAGIGCFRNETFLRYHESGGDGQRAFHFVLGNDTRTAGHRHLSASVGHHREALCDRGAEGAPRTVAFHYRPSALQGCPQNGRGQCGGCTCCTGYCCTDLQQQQGTVCAESGFGIQSEDCRERLPYRQGTALAGRSPGDKRAQQPFLYGSEKSQRRSGGSTALPCGRIGKRQSAAAVDNGQ